MNYAAIISELSISGSRLTDGSPNASGQCYFFMPGTNTPVSVYADAGATTIVTQPVTLGAGGKLPTQYAAGIFAKVPVRVYVSDVSGNVITDNVWMPASAGDVGVNNAGFTDSTLDNVLTKGFTSLGGQDWQYKESGGATARTIQSKFREGGISVLDFGADSTGIGISTTAFQAALSRATVLSCNVIVPAGTYKTDQALTLTSATGVQILGEGHGATIIKPTHGTANAFTFTSCTGCGIHGISITHSTGSTGAGVSASACLNFSISDLYIPANATFVGFAYGIDLSGNGTLDYLSSCYQINGSTRALRISNSGTSQSQLISDCAFGASSAAPVTPASGIEFNGATGTYYLFGNTIVGGTNNVLFSGGMPGIRFIGNSIGPVLGSVSFSGATAAMFPQIANSVDGTTIDVASGGTATPDLTKGSHIRIRATSTGASITIAAPTPAPSASQYGIFLFLDIFNNAGGAISNPYTVNAAYHLQTVPNQVDLNHNQYLLIWDPNSSVWRQVSLSVTT